MIQIRKATLKDVHALNALWKELMTYHDEVLLPQNPQLRPHLQKKKNAAAVFEGFLKKNIRSKNGCVFIAEDDKVAVGYCLLCIKKNIPIFALEKIGYLSDLFVKKKHRGQRISSLLKDAGMAWFREKGITFISIAVSAENTHAHSVYEKWGFFDYQTEMRRRI